MVHTGITCHGIADFSAIASSVAKCYLRLWERQRSKLATLIGDLRPDMDATTPPLGLRKREFDGRIERRSRLIASVHLATASEPRSSERAVTRNVSPHGARLVTKRLWRPGEEPLLTPPAAGEFPQMGQVVYCQPRARGGFYLGVHFSDHSVRWENS